MKKNSLFPGFIFLAISQTIVGISIVVSKLLLPHLPIILLLLFRFTLATFILLPLHWLTIDKNIPIKTHLKKIKSQEWFFIGLQGLSAGVFFNCLMLLGLHYTDANVAGIITSALPAIITVLSFILLKEKISLKKGTCILLASMGLTVIAFDKVNGVSNPHSFLGDFIVFLALIPEALYYVLVKKHPIQLPVFLASSLFNGMNAICLFPMIFFVHSDITHLTLNSWLLVLTLGMTSGAFYIFWFFGSKHIDGVVASLSTAIMPIATVIISWLVLGEDLTSLQLLGMGLVLFSIIVFARH